MAHSRPAHSLGESQLPHMLPLLPDSAVLSGGENRRSVRPIAATSDRRRGLLGEMRHRAGNRSKKARAGEGTSKKRNESIPLFPPLCKLV